ncbi:B-cell receptor CD22-like [Hoplias malabaricus]|uniref:B-cell receptor CD22-like n=1 Tax=Hoplias malabaricus TaxID=27720 RepID=UPI0034624F9C
MDEEKDELLELQISVSDGPYAVAEREWSVNYSPKSVCALKGSTLTMGCTYRYRKGHSVQSAFWTKQWPVNGVEPPDLLNDPEYRDRVQFTGDKQHNCTLRLRDVTEKDQSKYYFRFITDRTGGKYQGAGGVDLSVTDLQVEVPETVTEGDRVTLTCKTSCSLTDSPTFTWYKNGHGLSSRTDQLHLQSVSREDKGRYHCAVQGLNSPEVTLNVRYGPKSVSVSLRPSGEPLEDSSVTLTCSSDANPPPECNWFKGTSFLSKGGNYTMNRIRSVDSGEYKCKCRNKHGEKYSKALTLNILYPPKSVSVSIRSSGETVEDSSVTLTCSSDANPPVQNYTWFKEGETSPVGSGHSYTMNTIRSVDSGEYKCKCKNDYGEKYSKALTLNVLYGPKSVSVSLRPSSETVEDSSVTLTCSSDANPPVQNYTWFKEGETSPVGSGHSYSFIKNSRSSGWYYCFTQNEHGSKKSAAVPVSIEESSLILHVGVGVGVCGVVTVHSSPSDDLCTALDPQSRSPEYENLAVSQSTSTEDYFLMILVDRVVPQNNWGVNYSPKSICALKGSKVTMGCTYTYPINNSVQKAFWTKLQPAKMAEPPDLLNDPEYRDRVQFTGDKQHNCTLRLRDVTEKDQSKYYFRFITDQTGGKWQGAGGVDLSVTDLQVEVPETVTEGDKVTLTCKTSCSLTDSPTFTWYKNGHGLSSRTDQLHLQSVSREDKGRYHCAVQGLNSPEVTLNVRYGPKSVSLSIRPSGETVEDSSVTLTCSSDANPPPECNWFKGASFLSKGENYTMNRIRSVDSGEYKCKCRNKHGEKYSKALTLNVFYPPKSVSVSIRPSGETVEDSSVTLTCSSDANPPVQNYTWFKEGETSPVGSGHSYSALQSGSYYCVAQNEYGAQTAAAVSISVKAGGNVVLFAVIAVAAGGLSAIIVVLCIRKKSGAYPVDEVNLRELNLNSNVAMRTVTCDSTAHLGPHNQDDDVDYLSAVTPRDRNTRKLKSFSPQASGFGTDEEVQYDAVQHQLNETKKTENDIQYASIRFPHSCAANRSPPSALDDLTMIYSSVN